MYKAYICFLLGTTIELSLDSDIDESYIKKTSCLAIIISDAKECR